jgi:hypothetical protein
MYILEKDGYLKQENDNHIQFIKNIGGDLYTIIFINLYECSRLSYRMENYHIQLC